MKRKLLILAGILFLGTISFAQIQGDGGNPRTYDLKNIDARVFSTPDIGALKAEDAINDIEKTGPWRFGHNHYTDFNFTNSGTWSELSNGGKIWRIKVTCLEALTINLTFENLVIPEGNELYVYNPDKSFILGKFTARHLYQGQLGTELVPGSTSIVEYYVAPQNVNQPKSLTLNVVTHGYRTAQEFQQKAFGSSGSCNMNVACPEGVPWENQIRSAVMLVSGSSGFCSGAMINNTQNDGTPYVLTANHCYSNPASWIFRFNWQSATCNNPASSPSYVSLSGAVLRSRRVPSDFALVEITGGLVNGTVPDSYNTYFPGWDNSDDIPTSALCVHHPSGDIKKLAFDNNALSSSNGMGSSEPNSQWRTQWDLNTTTEPGSSGSPLFDQTGRIIGQLWGGGASCFNLSAPDYYGKVSYSWDPSGSNSTNQLKHWLDPNNDGNTVLDGYDPITICASTYSSSTTEELCYGDDSGSIDVVFTSGNSSGATFDIGTGPQATGSFTNLPAGSYTITVVDGDACATDVNVILGGPSQLTLGASMSHETAPNNGSINLSAFGGTPGFTFSWTGPGGFTASSEDISGLAAGVYSITVSDDNGCTTSGSYTINSLIGIDEQSFIAFNLFPNPSSGVFNIELMDVVNKEYKAEVTDLSGRLIYSEKIENQEFTLDLSNAANGSYLLHLSTNNIRTTKRITLRK